MDIPDMCHADYGRQKGAGVGGRFVEGRGRAEGGWIRAGEGRGRADLCVVQPRGVGSAWPT